MLLETCHWVGRGWIFIEMEIIVTCYAGYRGEETPKSMRIGDRETKVRSVKSNWQTPDYRYFEVLCDDGKTYRLRHDGNKWALL